MKETIFVVLVAAMLLVAMPLSAHHSFAAEFDSSKLLTLKGTITKMEWLNPHSWLYIEVKSEDGKAEEWAIEFGAPNSLYRRGWLKSSLPVGQTVTVSAYLAKDGSHKANAQDVVLPDGKKLFAGSAGTGAPFDEQK
jgi:hypothetical protein